MDLTLIGNVADLFGATTAALWVGRWIRVLWQGRSQGDNDLAIVLDLSKPIVKDVERFLRENSIQAEVISISPNPGSASLGERPEDWEGAVSEFAQIVHTMQASLGTRPLHIFLAGPSVLAFGMGCIAGMDFDVHLYHWFPEKRSYAKVLRISRSLL